jgi:hypothetical protein
MRRDQELEGADNTRFRQVQAAICVMPYVLYDGLYCLDVDLVILVLRGSLPALIYPGGQGYMNPSLILAQEPYSSTTRVVPSVSTSSTPHAGRIQHK